MDQTNAEGQSFHDILGWLCAQAEGDGVIPGGPRMPIGATNAVGFPQAQPGPHTSLPIPPAGLAFMNATPSAVNPFAQVAPQSAAQSSGLASLVIGASAHGTRPDSISKQGPGPGVAQHTESPGQMAFGMVQGSQTKLKREQISDGVAGNSPAAAGPSDAGALGRVQASEVADSLGIASGTLQADGRPAQPSAKQLAALPAQSSVTRPASKSTQPFVPGPDATSLAVINAHLQAAASASPAVPGPGGNPLHLGGNDGLDPFQEALDSMLNSGPAPADPITTTPQRDSTGLPGGQIASINTATSKSSLPLQLPMDQHLSINPVNLPAHAAGISPRAHPTSQQSRQRQMQIPPALAGAPSLMPGSPGQAHSDPRPTLSNGLASARVDDGPPEEAARFPGIKRLTRQVSEPGAEPLVPTWQALAAQMRWHRPSRSLLPADLSISGTLHASLPRRTSSSIAIHQLQASAEVAIMPPASIPQATQPQGFPTSRGSDTELQGGSPALGPAFGGDATAGRAGGMVQGSYHAQPPRVSSRLKPPVWIWDHLRDRLPSDAFMHPHTARMLRQPLPPHAGEYIMYHMAYTKCMAHVFAFMTSSRSVVIAAVARHDRQLSRRHLRSSNLHAIASVQDALQPDIGILGHSQHIRVMSSGSCRLKC